jgi:hypothetical protein
MTEGGASNKRMKSFRPRIGGQKARAASTRRQLWVAMLATAGAAAAAPASCRPLLQLGRKRAARATRQENK